VAIPLADLAFAERERVAPLAERLKEFIRQYDPEARFRLQVSNVPEFWELNAHVRTDLAHDLDLAERLAQAQIDLLLDYDVAICVIRHPREE
jgi:hypothetical protein